MMINIHMMSNKYFHKHFLGISQISNYVTKAFDGNNKPYPMLKKQN